MLVFKCYVLSSSLINNEPLNSDWKGENRKKKDMLHIRKKRESNYPIYLIVGYLGFMAYQLLLVISYQILFKDIFNM